MPLAQESRFPTVSSMSKRIDRSIYIDNRKGSPRALSPPLAKTSDVTTDSQKTTLVDVTFAERLEFVLKLHGWIPAQWAAKVRPKPLHRSHVYTLLANAKAKPSIHPPDKVTSRTLRGLAAAAGVSAAWLTENIGSWQDDYVPEPGEKSRKEASYTAARRGYSIEAIKEVLDSDEETEVDFGVDYYLAQIQAAHIRRERLAQEPPPSRTSSDRPKR